jgi:hypothetical protein
MEDLSIKLVQNLAPGIWELLKKNPARHPAPRGLSDMPAVV